MAGMGYNINDNAVVYIHAEINNMPKVNQSYLSDKKNQILDAAFVVCNRKPAYDVTMSDIVKETGMSQGGVYKYFNNIDLVFAALIDKANLQSNHIERIDKVMKSERSPEKLLQELFLISEQYFSEMLISYNKILFELSTFFAHSPERRERINKNVTTSSTFEYLTQCAFDIIIKQTKEGYFTPVIPIEDILAFIITAFDGIIRDITLTRCYPSRTAPDDNIKFDEKRLIHCLYISTITLLGKVPQC